MSVLAKVGQRELIVHCRPQVSWVAEQRCWSPAVTDGLIRLIGNIQTEPERRQEFCWRLERLMRACHERKTFIHDRGERGDRGKITTTMRTEVDELAAVARQVANSPDDSDIRWIGIGMHVAKLKDDTESYLDWCLTERSYIERRHGTPTSITKLDLADLIALLDYARATIAVQRGRAGCPVEYMLVSGLFDLWYAATGIVPTRSFRPRDVRNDSSKGVECGRFLAFCRAVLVAIEVGQPYAGADVERRLSRIVRTVIDEETARIAAASTVQGAT